MSKAHRGAGLAEEVQKGKGQCPVCKRTGIKLLYELEVDEKKLKLCKQCNAAVKAGKKKDIIATL